MTKIKRCFELTPETVTALGHKADDTASLEDALVNTMIRFCCRDTTGDFYHYFMTGRLTYDYRPTTHLIEESDIDKLYAIAERYKTSTDAILTEMIRYCYKDKGAKFDTHMINTYRDKK